MTPPKQEKAKPKTDKLIFSYLGKFIKKLSTLIYCCRKHKS